MKESMKRIVMLLAALSVMMTALPSFAADSVTRIVFWHSMSDDAGIALARMVGEFNETVGKEKGIAVEAVFQGKYSDATSKMNNILSAGNFGELPDVMNMDATGKVNYYTSGKAYTADAAAADDPTWDFDEYLEIALNNWAFSGVRLGIPFAASTTLMFYNKDLIPEAPETFADIAALAGLPGTRAVYAAVPDTPTLANWLGQLGSYVVDHRNGSEATAEKLDCLENGALVMFLTAWRDLYASGALLNESGSTDAFAVGDLAILTTSSSNIASLLAKTEGHFELGVAFYPRVSETAAPGATVSGSCLVMFDNGDDARKSASREFVRWMTGPEAQAEFAAETGYIPANKAAAETDTYRKLIAEHPQYAVGPEQLAATPAEMRSVTVGPAIDFYYAIQNNVMDMLDNGTEPVEAAGIMADELQGLLDQYLRNNR